MKILIDTNVILDDKETKAVIYEALICIFAFGALIVSIIAVSIDKLK